MSTNNIFEDNPIILNVLNVSSFSRTEFIKSVKQQVVWVSSFDESRKKIWKSPAKASKKYGVNVFGGNDLDTEDDEYQLDDIMFDDDDIKDLLAEEPSIKETTQIEKPFIVIEDIHIFPEDKISEFKKKIFVSTRIPPYRQHLWCEYKNKPIPLGYAISHDTPMIINIKKLRDNTAFYEGIPVDTQWYASKENIHVSALDDFQLLDQIYFKYGVTEFFLVDLNDFINPVRGNLERLLKKDMYSIELIYYGFVIKYWPHLTLPVFGEYLKNEGILVERYPELSPSITAVKNRFVLETAIVGKKYTPELDPKKWDVPVYTSITYSVISLTDTYVLPGTVVQLRNLFDLFALNDVVNFCICNLEIDGRPIILTKTFKKINITTKAPHNSILFNVTLPDRGNTYLIIHKKGSYRMESKWHEDQTLDFAMIYSLMNQYVKPVIEHINGFGTKVSTAPLTVLLNGNSVFSDINLSMFWKFNLSTNNFRAVKDIFNKYIDAGIMQRSSGTSLSHDFYFTKGMYKYDIGRYNSMNPTHNKFTYLTDASIKAKYDMYITRRKKLSVFHRFSDIKIEFSGLKEYEYVTFYIYILRLLESIPRIKGARLEATVKKLKQLKEKDPSLYEFKKMYGSDLVYSKLCQQQKQPVMHSDPGKNRVKFWNFTTNEPAYYSCPNPKYPYINFITHAHPKGYCIPCCYKLAPSKNLKDKKARIYETCMKDKKYDQDKRSVIKSRYVMAYGKPIDAGRLSRLPENTLEPLFYDTFSKNVDGIDQECLNDKGYYLFGVPQNISNASNIGFLFSIAHACGKNIIDFVGESIDLLRKKQDLWTGLMGGHIRQYFESFNILIDSIKNVFIGNTMSTFDRWNELFIDIGKIYWNISIMHFIDDGSSAPSVYLKIPGHIKYWDDYKSTNTHLIIMETTNTFNPVYVVNTDIFFKTGEINTKLFEHTSVIVGEIYNVAVDYIKKSVAKQSIDLHLIKRFAKNSNYNIVNAFINDSNLCYGVTIKHVHGDVEPFYINKTKSLEGEEYASLTDVFNSQNKQGGNIFFIPVDESCYMRDGTPIIFELFNETSNLKDILEFAKSLNSFITKISTLELKLKATEYQLMYPLIEVDSWLLHGVDVIGFKSKGLNFISKNVSKKTAISLFDRPFIKMLYHPTEVNKAIHMRKSPTIDKRATTIAHSLYDRYLYSIIIIELINLMDKQRNNVIRSNIIKLTKGITRLNPKIRELHELLSDYPEDFNTIHRLFVAHMTPDRGRTLMHSNIAFVNKGKMDKSDIVAIMDKATFTFDRTMLSDFKKMTHDKLKKSLMDIFNKLSIDKQPTFDGDFPNMIMSCDTESPYCSGSKLMIVKKKLEDLVDIMASDILNPVKSKYIFNPIFVKNTIDYFRFIIRNDEIITVSI